MSITPATCTVERARELTDQLRGSLEISWRLLREAFHNRVWEPLGYESWDAYCAGELVTGSLRLPREWRQEVVAELTSGEQPMSNRSVAAALGVDKNTVRKDRSQIATGDFSPVAESDDRSQTAGVVNATPDPEDEDEDDEIVDAEIIEDEVDGDPQPEPEPESQRRLGADGKMRRQPREIPAVKPRRSPLMDDLDRVIVQMDKGSDRLRKLSRDDRFASITEQLAKRHRNELTHIKDVVNDILAQLP